MMSSRRVIDVIVLVALCAAAACTATQGAQDSGDPSGLWVGDFGPAFYDRNTISLELHWDGKELTGMIRPGVQGGRMYRSFQGFPIENASYDPKTGTFRFEATYKPRARRYFIEGKLQNDRL